MKKENRSGQIRSGFKENPGRLSSEDDTCVMYVVKLPSATNHCVELLYCNECGHTTPDTSSAYCPQCGREVVSVIDNMYSCDALKYAHDAGFDEGYEAAMEERNG